MKVHQSIGFGFTPAEIPKWIGTFFFGFVVACVIALGIRFYDSTKPALHIIRYPNEFAAVRGTLVVVRVHQSRDRLPCADAHADRVMIHMPPGANPESDNFDALIFFREGRVAVTHDGMHDFDMYLNLQSPLPNLPSGAWYYRANIYNGCNWTGKLFGGELPIPTPTIPARIITQAPH